MHVSTHFPHASPNGFQKQAPKHAAEHDAAHAAVPVVPATLSLPALNELKGDLIALADTRLTAKASFDLILGA